jgi:hypothetical protein
VNAAPVVMYCVTTTRLDLNVNLIVARHHSIYSMSVALWVQSRILKANTSYEMDLQVSILFFLVMSASTQATTIEQQAILICECEIVVWENMFPIRFGAHPISHTLRIDGHFKLDAI